MLPILGIVTQSFGDFAYSVGVSVAFFVVGILALLCGYFIFDKFHPTIHFDQELLKNNHAVAIVIGAFLLGLAHIIAQCVS